MDQRDAQAVFMEPGELAARLSRDAVGCLCGVADAAMQAAPLTFDERMRLIELIRNARDVMVSLGGPDKFDGQDIGLGERAVGADLIIRELWEHGADR